VSLISNTSSEMFIRRRIYVLLLTGDVTKTSCIGPVASPSTNSVECESNIISAMRAA
jgi:hypothetical protein